jgi:hypothetical protein
MYQGEGLEAVGKGRRKTRVGVDFSVVSRDVGCPEVSPSCFTCPLPQCIYDIPVPQRAEFRARFLATPKAPDSNSGASLVGSG